MGALLLGTLVMHLATLPIFHGMQQTVVLFVVGVLVSLAFSEDSLNLAKHLGPVGRSYEMAMAIDHHLLLFSLLPPLLAGDAMSIDMVVATKVAKQCLYLAGPGVAVNGFLCALFLWVYLPYEWPFMLCFSTGAILCATDPVAVVALLKELGASPTLTVQIQGESLLNDGSAIVMFTIAYDILSGQETLWGDVVAKFVKMAVLASLLGIVMGGFFWLWIKAARDKLNHSSSTIQVLLTIAAAYLSFMIAEWLKLSGVLCTVMSSLVLAKSMWPQVVCHETMHTVWHMLENLGNTLIFFLAGTLTGKIMIKTALADYGHLLLIYAVLVVLRFGLIILSRPLLALLGADGRPVPLADAIVMSWGGLRGAVGLALGIQVSRDQAGGKVDAENANRVLFYVGGVALLTLLINALTCPALVKWLQITQTPDTKRKLMAKIHQQLVDDFLENDGMRTGVKQNLDVMLGDLKDHIFPDGRETAADARRTLMSKVSERLGRSILGQKAADINDAQDVMDRFAKEQGRFDDAPEDAREHVRSLLPCNHLLHRDQVEGMADLLEHSGIDQDMQRAINEAFLSLVKASYWHQMEHEEISHGEHSILVGSVSMALSSPTHQVNDLFYLRVAVQRSDEQGIFNHEGPNPSMDEVETRPSFTELKKQEAGTKGAIQKVCESVGFRLFIFLAILSNVVLLLVEEAYPAKPGTTGDHMFFGLEAMFVAIFLVEAVLKFSYRQLYYFSSSWNVFDFALVVLGILGTVMSIINWGEAVSDGNVAQATRMFKVLRTVRVMRLVKSFKLVAETRRGASAASSSRKYVRGLIIFQAFINAHNHSQHELIRFLGRHGHADTPELARCILQSLTDCYKAMNICCMAENKITRDLLEERDTCQQSIQATSGMEDFVMAAQDGGILSASEAEVLVHNLHHHWSRFMRRIKDVRQGRQPEKVERAGEHDEDSYGQGTRPSHMLDVEAAPGDLGHQSQVPPHDWPKTSEDIFTL
mmetsp:Transcript_9954/g.31619  ORF Transcript_9954/g.31619 Transcript_9954/m.31619 type:complete len:987 (+) Transcript_9954:94-3054(+)